MAPYGWAGSWGSESSVSLSSEYLSNPYMQPSDARAAEGMGLLMTLPASYVGNDDTFDFTPRLRFAHSWRNASLLSNYQYFDAGWRAVRERDALQLSAAWHHDSTQYNAFETAVLHGFVLQRTEQTAGSDWQRSLTERSALHLVGSWDAVSYAHNPSFSLSNYRYGQASLQYDHDLTERLHWTGSLGAGRYTLPDSPVDYRSDNRFAQLGLTGQLTEVWSLTASAGMSDVSDHEQTFFATASASKSAPSFTFDAQRRGERNAVELSVAHTIQPSGLGALVTQDDAFLRDTLNVSERLSVGADVHGQRVRDTLQRLSIGELRNEALDLTANWQWTEHWNANLQLSLYRRSDVQPAVQASGVGVFLTATRQFGRKPLN
jgi:hypothetical protein